MQRRRRRGVLLLGGGRRSAVALGALLAAEESVTTLLVDMGQWPHSKLNCALSLAHYYDYKLFRHVHSEWRGPRPKEGEEWLALVTSAKAICEYVEAKILWHTGLNAEACRYARSLGLRVENPLDAWGEYKVVMLGAKLNVPFQLSGDCSYLAGGGEACGRCGECERRRTLLIKVLGEDRTRYANVEVK